MTQDQIYLVIQQARRERAKVVAKFFRRIFRRSATTPVGPVTGAA